MDKLLTCCFTGPRPKDLWGYKAGYQYSDLVRYLKSSVLPDLYDKGYRSFITGGAQGFDQIAFEALYKFKRDVQPDIETVIYAPCIHQEEPWLEGTVDTRFSRKYYRKMLSLADRVEYVTDKEYTPTCMNARNEAMINDSSALVALYDDDMEFAKKGVSGTQNTIVLASEKDNYPILQIHFDLRDSTNYELEEFISNDVYELRKRHMKNTKDRNVLYVNDNPVPALPKDGFGTVICLDTETTGFSAEMFDELLQIAIVDNCGNEYMTYIKPDQKKTWAGAEKVNHISPSMVKDAPSARNVIKVLQPYINSANTIVGHNVIFDLGFLQKAGLKIPEYVKVHDTCTFFKEDVKGGKHNLEAAITHYCPQYLTEYRSGAHDALTDTRATMRVYEAQLPIMQLKTISENAKENDVDEDIDVNIDDFDEEL